MAGSYFGNILRVTTFGESHGAGVGAVLDGFPAGMELTNEDIQEYLDRRKPGRNSISTPRKEDDLVEILSGTFEGKTTGTPIALLIRNKLLSSFFLCAYINVQIKLFYKLFASVKIAQS